MSDEPKGNVKRLLEEWGDGKDEALGALVPLVYQELKNLIDARGEPDGARPPLSAAALVNEAFEQLVGEEVVDGETLARFFAIASGQMRRILVDDARARPASGDAAIGEAEGPDLVALDQALTSLTMIDPRHAKLVDLRYFCGLSIDDTARVLDLSSPTVKREWAMAKAWLKRELDKKPGSL